MKRLLSLIIVIILLLTALPVSSLAAGSSSEKLSIEGVAAANNNNDVNITVMATDTGFGTYTLYSAVYDSNGKMLAADAQTTVFDVASKTFSSTMKNVPTARKAKVFFLTADYKPVGSMSATISNSDKKSIASLAQTHTSKSISSVSGIEAYSDHYCSGTNVTADLSHALGLTYSLNVSNITLFSSAPKTYNLGELIEWGKDPGLGIDILHKYGYAGNGAVISYIDQPLKYPLHPEYENANLHYTNTVTGNGSDNSMHGAAVLSLLAGKDTGVAPDAEIYYYSHASWEADQATHANCLYQIIEKNKTSAPEKKIRMVGFSDNIDENEKNSAEFRSAVASCEDAGIMVWFCGDYGAASFLPMSDKSDPENLTRESWANSNPELVFVPAGGRTTAITVGGGDYAYWADGGLSWTMPYMLGLYSIAISVDSSLTKDNIRSLVSSTAYTNSCGMKIVNPIEFVAQVLERVGKTEDAQQLRTAANNSREYLYAIMDTALLSDEDLSSIAQYLSCLTCSSVLVVDAADYEDAASIYNAVKTDHYMRGGTISGIQIFGTPSMVPAFSIKYKVQTASGVDNGDTFLSDIFFGNLSNDALAISTGYNVCSHFANNLNIDLIPSWPVVRLPLSTGEYKSYFEKYYAFAKQTELTQQTIVNFSNPIFAASNHIDDMGIFLDRLRKEFSLFDSDSDYELYGNLKGQYPVTNNVLGGFTTENLSKVNTSKTVEFLINSHGQRNNIDCCYYDSNGEQRESLINSTNINSVLNSNAYYLDCWTCNNAYGMSDNLVTTALNGSCMGAFASTSIISNNGVNNTASLADMQKSNFYYFYYQYLTHLDSGVSRTQAFYAAQKAYAQALIADSANGIRADGNYQFNLYNLIAYENFGIVEPSLAAIDMFDNSGYISQAGQSVPKETEGSGGSDIQYKNNALTSGVPISTAWSVPYSVGSNCSIAESYTIYGLTAQQLDNGYIRITLDYKAPENMLVDAFDPPNGSRFMLYGDKVTGNRETFSYDVSYENLMSIDTIVMKFFGNGKAEDECQYVMANPTDITVGFDESKSPKIHDIEYFINDSMLVTGSVSVHSYQYEKLSSGDYRFYLTLTAPKGMNAFFFSPPDGDVFWGRLDMTTGSKQTYSFDVSASGANSVDTIMVSLNFSDNDRCFIGIYTSKLS